MRTRTQIYLDADQVVALRLLAVARSSNVSDIVREAIDRLLTVDVHSSTVPTVDLDRVEARIRARSAAPSRSTVPPRKDA